jgi:hypothetical protein
MECSMKKEVLFLLYLVGGNRQAENETRCIWFAKACKITACFPHKYLLLVSEVEFSNPGKCFTSHSVKTVLKVLRAFTCNYSHSYKIVFSFLFLTAVHKNTLLKSFRLWEKCKSIDIPVKGLGGP